MRRYWRDDRLVTHHVGELSGSQRSSLPGAHVSFRGVQEVTETTSAGDTAVIEADVREGTYGDKIATIEPGGAEYIPLSERHGKPLQQFWTWVSPNMEFATIFVGIIGVWFFGQSFWAATLAIVLGTALGSVSMGVARRARPAVRRAADGAVPVRLRLPRQHPAGRDQRAGRGRRLVRR